MVQGPFCTGGSFFLQATMRLGLLWSFVLVEGQQPPANRTYKHDFEAFVSRQGRLSRVPLPLYVVDVYMGGWNEYDQRQNPHLDLGTKTWYAPDPIRVGNYSTEQFGDPMFVRRRLKLLRDSGLTPAIHIMNRHLIARNTTGGYYLKRWDDEGAMVNGTMCFSVDLFTRLYQPLLEELQMPHMLIYDLWGFSVWVPGGTPTSVFNRLYWDELSFIHRSLKLDKYAGLNGNQNNHHIRVHEYSDNRSPESLHFAVYLYEGTYTPGVSDVHPGRPRRFNLDRPRRVANVCAQSLRLSLLQSLGNPGGTGSNPYTGEQLALNDIFWVSWYGFTPDVRACPALSDGQGTYNIVNSNQISNFSQALKEEAWTESVDNAGPRYFFGYIHHIHDKRSLSNPRHTSISGTHTEVQFLTHRAREKGLVFTSIWNDYGESVVLEPAIRVGATLDVHADAGNESFLENFVREALRPQMRSTEGDIGGWQMHTDTTAISWALPHKPPGSSGNGTLCLGATDSAAICRARCEALETSNNTCTAFTWHDEHQGEWAHLCYARINGVWMPAAAAGHTSGRYIGVGGGSCQEEEQCWGAGSCKGGRCVCDPGWRGLRCQQLHTLPAPVAPAYEQDQAATWGGSVLCEDKKCHMWVSEMEGGCGLSSWAPKSQVVHAISSQGPLGPFARQEVVHPPFHHNPTVVRAPNGTLLMFLIGHTYNESLLRWTPYESPVFLSHAPSADGNWSAPVVAVAAGARGTWDSDTTNPTAAFLPNGSIAVVFRGEPRWGPGHEAAGLALAEGWTHTPYPRANEAEPLGITAQVDNLSIEDYHLWRNPRGNWQILAHFWDKEGGKVAVGRYAWSRDLLRWHVSPVAPYTVRSERQDGTVYHYCRRERPQVLLGPDGHPTHLFNGALLRGEQPFRPNVSCPGHADNGNCGTQKSVTIVHPLGRGAGDYHELMKIE